MELREYFTDWVARPSDVTPEWRATQASLFRRHVLPVLGRKDLSSIGPADIRDLMASTHGLSRETRNKIVFNVARRVLSDAAFSDAEMPQETFWSIYRSIRPLRKDPQRDPIALNPEQQDRLIHAIHRIYGYEPWLFTIWGFGVGTRPNEALGLRFQAIDMAGGKASIVEGRRGTRRTKLKSLRSRRIVDVPDHVIRALHPTVGTDYVFKLNYRAYREDVWTPTVRKLDIVVDGVIPTPYAMRASYISRCLMAGIRVAHVAAQVGARPSTIESEYWRYTPRDDFRLSEIAFRRGYEP